MLYNNCMKPQRNVAVDIIRLLAGVGVIWIHVSDPFISYPPFMGVGGTPWWVLNFINVIFRSSVPLFIMISGLLLLDITKPLDYRNFYLRRFSKIGIPTALWITIYSAIYIILGEIRDASKFIYALTTVNIADLYFLILILELYFVTPLLHTFLKNSGKKTLRVLVFCTFVFTTIITASNYAFPHNAVNLTGNIVTVFLPFLFYYLLGLFLKNVKISLSSVTSLIIIYFYLSIFIGIISNGLVNSYTRNFEGIPVIILTIVAFVTLLQVNSIKLLHNKKIARPLQYLSSLVFGAYLAHVLILLLFDKVLRTMTPESVGGLTIQIAVLKFLIVLTGAFGLAALIRKVPVIKFLSA